MHNIFFILKKKGYSILEYTILNYYWIITFGGLFWLATGSAWLDATLIPMVIYALFFFFKKGKRRHSLLDSLWWLLFLWPFFTWITNDYPHKLELILRCFSEQISYMFVYWIVRNKTYINVANIIKSAYLPLILTVIIGIYCFIFEPSWYASRTKDFATDFEEFEFKRLRSIFMDGYVIMYLCAIVIVYEFFLLAKGNLKIYVPHRTSIRNKLKAYFNPNGEPMHLMLIGICFFAIFLGIQRSAIVAIFVGLMLAVYYALRYTSIKNIGNLLKIFIFSLLLCIISITTMEGEQQLFYVRKVASVVEDSETLASDRMFHNKRYEYDLVGDGTGRHNMYADNYNPYTSMRDGEYNKILTEQGYIGAGLYILFVVVALFKAWINFRYLGFEFAMIFVLLISMIGANPLSTFDKHPVLFWMIFGQIANFRRNGKRIGINNNSNL